MKRVCKSLSVLFAVFALGYLCFQQFGCAANPVTGKQEFSPAVAYQATTQPVVQAAAAAVLPPWGSVILGGLSLAFLALSKTHDASTLKAAIVSTAGSIAAAVPARSATPATSPNSGSPAPPPPKAAV